MQEHYECQDEYQEHFECKDEHQELIFEKFSRRENMQDTKLKNFQTLDTNNLKMHMKNKKRHKTRKYEDQTRRLVKNNLKIMKNTCISFQKMHKFLNMQLTPNLKVDSRLKQETQKNIFDYMIL